MDIESSSLYVDEVRKLVNVKEKKWNTHMLRVCTKHLTELERKDFKKARRYATLSNNTTLEKQIMEDMLVEKVKNINSEGFAKFYKKLTEFEAVKHLHPRKKYIDY
jgi:hypothetical protein